MIMGIIPTSLGDVERGLRVNVSKRVTFQELSRVADLSRGKNNIVSLLVHRKLRQMAEVVAKIKG
jgi:hypothetical protein